MARIVHTVVSVSGYLAVRYSFWISVFCDRVVYPVFLSSPRSFGLSALEDQQCAGALMWTCVTFVYLIAGAAFTARLLSPHRSEELLRSEELAIPQFDSRRVAERHTDPHRMKMEAV